MASTRSSQVDYKQLHNFSSVVLYGSASSRRRRSKLYDVERIISKRKIRHDTEYLIKWTGWPLESCSWEPSENVTSALLRSYEKPPKPTDRQLSDAARSMYCAIQSGLKSKSLLPISVEMPLVVWRYIVNGKGTPSDHPGHTMFEHQEFSGLTTLPAHWRYYLNMHGEGMAIEFPLKVKAVVSWSGKKFIKMGHALCEAPKIPVEKLQIGMARRACNTDNI